MGASTRALLLATSFFLACADACHTVLDTDTNETYAKCYKNIVWARETGLSKFPQYYVNYTLNGNSSVKDFQEALHSMRVNPADGNASGHGCPEPCPSTVNDVNAIAKVNNEGGSGLPWWGWLLIVLGVCCCLLPLLGLCCAAFLCYEVVAFILDPLFGNKEKKRPQKKKRAVKPASEAAPTATPAEGIAWNALVSQPVATTAVPMPVYTPSPAASAFAFAPSVTQSVTYAAPAVTYAPAATYAAPAPMSAVPIAGLSYPLQPSQ